VIDEAGDRSDFSDEKMAGIAPTRKKIEEMRHGGQAHFLGLYT
jgi:hypothetical protein